MENNTALETLSNSIRTFTEKSYFNSFLNFFTQLLIIMLLGFIIYYLVHIGNRYVDENRRVNIKKKQIVYFLLSIIIMLLILFIFQIRTFILQILYPFILAIVLAYTLNPLVKYLNSKGIKRLWGVLIIYLTVSFIIFLITITLIPQMVNEVKKLLELLPRYGNETYDYLYNLFIRYNRNIDNLPRELDGVKDLLHININRVQQIIFNVLTSVTDGVLNMFSKIVGLILIPILGFYFLKDAEEFKKALILLIPSRIRKEALIVVKDIDIVLGGFIRGQLIVAAIVGLLTTISLLILKVEFAVLVGLIAGLANIIPYFGPIIGIVPAVIFALLDNPMKAIWVVIIFTIIQQVESAILSPKIVGKSVGIHPIWVLLALLIGGRLYGLVGLLIAVPTAGIIKVLGKHLKKYVVKS
ncbi:AI-2E family transporter [Alkaliphilus peptidifermentans]|uniref:Sporulation integral membrane protein YtvI n=1 Tax=Alkaliphilus peptidifermentans DSM 18978 TaxID=1120976 RepID=A0A1G5H3M2_9FIRM|nr:AI-2E family transporter [Alkaliphilus peptidifermentans]SCY58287.1 sporulation integral membrane protein YtvI [Alkaliphilus peptidifermentans DSM 18978]